MQEVLSEDRDMLCTYKSHVTQVHVPLYDPSSVMLLAVCSAQPKVHRARVLTRAVRSVLAQVFTFILPLLSFLVLSLQSHASAFYMLTKKAVPQFPSLQLYTSRCTLLTLLSGQLQIAMRVCILTSSFCRQ